MEVNGFWSYAHRDLAHPGSRIANLKDEITEELGLMLGDEVDLFIDMNKIRTGDDWRLKIRDALQSANFFIPILTPRYFKSAECRGEIVYFLKCCKEMGTTPMIFPIYLVNVWGFGPKSRDGLKRQMAQLQYLDFRDLRSSDGQMLRRIVQEFCLDVLERLDDAFKLQEHLSDEEPYDASEEYEDLDLIIESIKSEGKKDS